MRLSAPARRPAFPQAGECGDSREAPMGPLQGDGSRSSSLKLAWCLAPL